MTPQPRSAGPWSQLGRLDVVNSATWVRLGRLDDDTAPYRLDPTPPGVRVDEHAGRLTLTLPADCPEVVHLRLAPGWEPHLHLHAHAGGRFGYDHADRMSSFDTVTATVREGGTVELPVVKQLRVDNDGGTVNVRAVEQRCDLRAPNGPICVGDARGAAAELNAGQFGLIRFERANPRDRRIVGGDDRIHFAEDRLRAESVDRARTAFPADRSPTHDAASADGAPAPATPGRPRAPRRSR